jgi:hypothetical protein
MTWRDEDPDLVPFQVTRVWTVLAHNPHDAQTNATPGSHHDVSIRRMPCGDWPAPCDHTPAHARPE